MVIMFKVNPGLLFKLLKNTKLGRLIKLTNIIIAKRIVEDHSLLALGLIFNVGHLVTFSGKMGEWRN